ncbi:MAG: hypothetical protein QOF81_699 [Acidimicrobiaceae bacterium]|nr:hypothetical protein [Acidimicrobiaceae bacterium]
MDCEAPDDNPPQWTPARRTPTRRTRLRFAGAASASALVLIVSSLVGAGAGTAAATPATAAATPSDSTWAIQAVATPAVAPNGQLTATACPSATQCISVGVAQDASGRDTALAESWNGTRSKGQLIARPTGAVGTFLAAVSCPTTTTCTAVGNLQTGSGTHVTLAERWNGADWEAQSTPNPNGATDSFLSGVSCLSPSDCTAVGYSVDPGHRNSTLAERWNGRMWQLQSTPNAAGATNNALKGVSCTAANAPTPTSAGATACTAVGTATTNFSPQSLIERWNGTTWQLQVAAVPVDASGSTLTAVTCTTSTACTAVGNFTAKSTKAGGALAEQWDGVTWVVEPTSGSTLDFLNAVACTTPASCTAVGQTGFSDPIAQRWDGTSWAAQTVPKPDGALQTGLVGIACPVLNACFATGSSLYTRGQGTNLTVAEQWNGDRWAIQPSFDPSGATAFALAGVSCASARACMAVGFYYDAAGTRLTLAEEWNGSTWTIQPTPKLPNATDAALGSVSCLSAQDCTSVGAFSDPTGVQSALAEHWNGRTWSVQPTAGPASAAATALNSVSCTTRNACTAAGAYVDRAGTAFTLVERWNGTLWETQPTPNPSGALYVAFNGVACPTPSSCTAVGLLVDANFRYLTFAEHWNGTTWEIQPTPNPDSTDGPNGTLEGGVSCPAPDACTAVGQWSPAPAPHPGVSLAERWNGLTWEVQATPNPPAVDAVDGTHNAPLAGVSCPTTGNCTAVGNYDSGNATGDFLPLAVGWNGTRWSVQAAAAPVGAFYSTLRSVACPAPHTCIAVGDTTRYNDQTNTRGRSTALAEADGS